MAKKRTVLEEIGRQLGKMSRSRLFPGAPITRDIPRSALNALVELSPVADVRDINQGLGQAGRGVRTFNPNDIVGGLGLAALGTVGLVPGAGDVAKQVGKQALKADRHIIKDLPFPKMIEDAADFFKNEGHKFENNVRDLPGFKQFNKSRQKKIIDTASFARMQEFTANDFLSKSAPEIKDAFNEAVARGLRKKGWKLDHTSRDGKKVTSRYFESPDGQNTIRLSDHELPDTESRRLNRAIHGEPWTDINYDFNTQKPSDIVDDIVSNINSSKTRPKPKPKPIIGRSLKSPFGVVMGEIVSEPFDKFEIKMVKLKTPDGSIIERPFRE